MSYSVPSGPSGPNWSAQPQPMYGHPAGPQGPRPSSALAITGFIVGLIAFLCGWIPFLGLVLGAAALLLSVLAVRKPVLRGLAITGIILSVIAGLTSLVTSALFTLALIGGSDSSSPQSESKQTHAPEDFVEIDDRALAGIAKDPDAHAGETLILYGYVSQFDANTGPCEMRVSVSAEQQSSWMDYEHNALAYSGDGDDTCPELDDVLQDDQVKLTVVLEGGKTYSSLGGGTRVPYFEVIDAEVL